MGSLQLDRGDVDDDDRDDRDEHPDWDEDEDPCPDCGEPAGLGHASDCGVAAMMLADMVAGDDATAIDRVLADPAAQALSLDSPADRDRLRELLVAALAGRWAVSTFDLAVAAAKATAALAATAVAWSWRDPGRPRDPDRPLARAIVRQPWWRRVLRALWPARAPLMYCTRCGLISMHGRLPNRSALLCESGTFSSQVPERPFLAAGCRWIRLE